MTQTLSLTQPVAVTQPPPVTQNLLVTPSTEVFDLPEFWSLINSPKLYSLQVIPPLSHSMFIQSNMYQLHDLYLLQKGATQTTSMRQSSLVLILKIVNFEARVTKLAINVTWLNIRYFDKN